MLDWFFIELFPEAAMGFQTGKKKNVVTDSFINLV